MTAKKKPRYAYRLGWRSLKRVAPSLTDARAKTLAVELAAAMMKFPPRGGWTEKTASDFIAQCAHESGEFRYTRELWGPTPTQSGYWRRRELHGPGALYPGLGYVTRGAGYIQTTGRNNFRAAAKKLGIRLTTLYARAGATKYAALMAAIWWQNRFPDGTRRMTVRQVTKAVNGGYNGLDERITYTARARKVAKYLVPERRPPT